MVGMIVGSILRNYIEPYTLEFGGPGLIRGKNSILTGRVSQLIWQFESPHWFTGKKLAVTFSRSKHKLDSKDLHPIGDRNMPGEEDQVDWPLMPLFLAASYLHWPHYILCRINGSLSYISKFCNLCEIKCQETIQNATLAIKYQLSSYAFEFDKFYNAYFAYVVIYTKCHVSYNAFVFYQFNQKHILPRTCWVRMYVQHDGIKLIYAIHFTFVL